MACSPSELRNAVTPLADELGELVAPEKAQQVQENQDMLSGKRKAESADLKRAEGGSKFVASSPIETIKKIKDKLREAGHSEELKKEDLPWVSQVKTLTEVWKRKDKIEADCKRVIQTGGIRGNSNSAKSLALNPQKTNKYSEKMY